MRGLELVLLSEGQWEALAEKADRLTDLITKVFVEQPQLQGYSGSLGNTPNFLVNISKSVLKQDWTFFFELL